MLQLLLASSVIAATSACSLGKGRGARCTAAAMCCRGNGKEARCETAARCCDGKHVALMCTSAAVKLSSGVTRVNIDEHFEPKLPL